MHSYPSDIPDYLHGRPFSHFRALADKVLVAASVRVGCRELVDKATLYSTVEAGAVSLEESILGLLREVDPFAPVDMETESNLLN